MLVPVVPPLIIPRVFQPLIVPRVFVPLIVFSVVLRLMPVLITDQFVLVRFKLVIGAVRGALTRIDGAAELISSGTAI